MNYINLIAFTISLLSSYIGSPMILDMLKRGKSTKTNYRGQEIPIGMGLIFVLVQFLTLGIIIILKKENFQYTIFYLFAISLIGIIGLLDDLTGEEDIKGFKGHIKSFFKGILTTGGMKAGVGFLIALFISIIISDNYVDIIVNTLLIALFTNLTNLFDLRPGRALKVFILLSLIMLFSSGIKEYNFILYSFYGILLVYLPVDLKARAMMGDIGSNVLGITLGIYCSLTHNIISKLIYLFLLIFIHIIGEKVSFSSIIENNKFLSFIDNLGR